MHEQSASAFPRPLICAMVHGVKELVRRQDGLLGVAKHLNPIGFEEALEVPGCLPRGGQVVFRAVADARKGGQDVNLALFGPLEEGLEVVKALRLGRKAEGQRGAALVLVR